MASRTVWGACMLVACAAQQQPPVVEDEPSYASLRPHTPAPERRSCAQDELPLTQWMVTNTPEKAGAQSSTRHACDADVAREGDDVVLRARARPPPAFVALGGEVTFHQVEDGWIVASNEGEFGGDVFWFSTDRRYRKSLGGANVSAIVDVGGEVWLAEGLDHLRMRDGSILRANHAGPRTWALVRIAKLADAAYAITAESSSAALVVTSSQLLRVTSTGVVTTLHETHWNPRSVAVDSQGRVFIGMFGRVVRLTPVSVGYTEESLVPP